MRGSSAWQRMEHRWNRTPNGRVLAVFISVALMIGLVIATLIATR